MNSSSPNRRSLNFRDRLDSSVPILLDGATGTELARRGVDISGTSWTASAIRDDPQVLQEIHRDYVEAGAEVITANTFRTHSRSLMEVGLADMACQLTIDAVALARSVTPEEIFVAGSIAPLEDCYAPNLAPDNQQLRAGHAEKVEHLLLAGVDVLLVETQNTIREATVAAGLAADSGLPFMVSFVCNSQGCLLSGEPFADAYQRIACFSPTAILVNCLAVEDVSAVLAAVSGPAFAIPFGVYANTGRLLPDSTWEETAGVLPAVYAEFARRWLQSGIRLIGGCCGTTPEHISALRRVIYEEFSGSE